MNRLVLAAAALTVGFAATAEAGADGQLVRSVRAIRGSTFVHDFWQKRAIRALGRLALL